MPGTQLEEAAPGLDVVCLTPALAEEQEVSTFDLKGCRKRGLNPALACPRGPWNQCRRGDSPPENSEPQPEGRDPQPRVCTTVSHGLAVPLGRALRSAQGTRPPGTASNEPKLRRAWTLTSASLDADLGEPGPRPRRAWLWARELDRCLAEPLTPPRSCHCSPPSDRETEGRRGHLHSAAQRAEDLDGLISAKCSSRGSL